MMIAVYLWGRISYKTRRSIKGTKREEGKSHGIILCGVVAMSVEYRESLYLLTRGCEAWALRTVADKESGERGGNIFSAERLGVRSNGELWL